ncbi:MAG: hypothetical protein KF870_09125 [Leadbetterella sp.]|nr:hypothetical protein [Leadbetterella sp.]
MNKALASFIFTGETLFNRQDTPVIEEAKPSSPPPPSKKIPAKSTLVLVDFLPEADRDFLTKIMASVGVALPDMEILEQQRFPEYDLPALPPGMRILAFGDFSQVLQLTEKPPKYRPAAHAGSKILLADTLSVIGQNLTNEKRNLWNALKEIYGLS